MFPVSLGRLMRSNSRPICGRSIPVGTVTLPSRVTSILGRWPVAPCNGRWLPLSQRGFGGWPRWPRAVGSNPVGVGERGMMLLTDRLWSSIEDIFAAILDHPFLRGLTDGSLDRESFQYYVVQDALYLTEYARALAVCGARAPDDEAIRMFCEHAAGAIAVERQLHEGFFREFGLSEEKIRITEMAPTNLAYTSYLLAVVHSGSFPESLGAVLPCYWIYWEVGKHLLGRGSPDPLYQRWIETYGGEEYGEIVRAVLQLTNRIAKGLSEGELTRMSRRFRDTARYEWMFWDMGYRRESWPV
jgi:thiaminase/transcriptional activator TenA